MDNKIEKKFSIKISQIELLNNYEYIKKNNNDFYIYSASSIINPQNNTIIFTNRIFDFSNLYGCLIIVNENLDINENENNIFIKVKNPRLEYARVLKYILNKVHKASTYKISERGYYYGQNIKIGKNTIIEPLVFIDDNVEIGDDCYIKTGAKIRKYSKIGNECIIKENCVIGSSGFGLEKDESSNVYKIPHLGGVIIKDKVEVGALVSIASGTIEPTIIEDNVQIDDCAFIAHNCYIGKSTYIIANAEISGSVIVGENCWIGPNSSIRQKLKIGDKSMVGIGSVVTKNIDENSIVAGNPAEDIERLKIKRRYEEKNIIEVKKD